MTEYYAERAKTVAVATMVIIFVTGVNVAIFAGSVWIVVKILILMGVL